MKHFLSSQKDTIFKNVEVLIYVFDVESDKIEVRGWVVGEYLTGNIGRYAWL